MVWICGDHDLGIESDTKDAVHIQELPERHLHRLEIDIQHVRASQIHCASWSLFSAFNSATFANFLYGKDLNKKRYLALNLKYLF